MAEAIKCNAVDFNTSKRIGKRNAVTLSILFCVQKSKKEGRRNLKPGGTRDGAGLREEGMKGGRDIFFGAYLVT